MAVNIVLANCNTDLLRSLRDALAGEGFSISAFGNSMQALVALENDETVDLLIAGMMFPSGQPNGLSIARMTRLKRPNFSALFVDDEHLEQHLDEWMAFVPASAKVQDLVSAAISCVAEPSLN